MSVSSETPLHLSHSSLKSFRRCKRQFYYKYVEGLEPRRTKDTLKRGIWMHELLEAHYGGGDWKAKQKELTTKFNNLMLDEREYYGPLPAETERMMKGYLFHYREEDKDWEVLHCEERFTVEVTDFTLSFKPDLIVYEKSTGLTLCVDHKTTRSLPDYDWKVVDLQSAVYLWALREAGIDVDLFVFNYIRTKPPTVPKINKDGSISKRRIDTDYYTLARFLKDYYGDDFPKSIPDRWKVQLKTLKQHNRYLKRSRVAKDPQIVERLIHEVDWTAQEIQAWLEMMEADKGEDIWGRTMLRSCDWDCGFYDLCVAELLGHDSAFIRKKQFQKSEYAEELIDLGG